MMCVLGLAGSADCSGQAPEARQPDAAAQASVAAKSPGTAKQKKSGEKIAARLSIETVKVPSETAEVFAHPTCDSDGNLYFRTDPDGVAGIRKLNGKGERMALFQATSPNVKASHPAYFTLGPNGDVYQLIFAPEMSRYVFVYKADGTVKSEIKLQPGFPFFPSRLAIFASGDILVSGLEYDKDRAAPMRPVTGIFSSDGALRKEVMLEDDEKIHDMAVSGDPKVTSPQNPSANYAVIGGAAEIGSDGNVYLMRRLSPAILYAISAGGAVVRRFTVDAGDGDFLPSGMHIAGNRISVLFRKEQTRQEVIKIVDLEGNDIATYDEPVIDGRHALGPAFLCYADNPERFIFLTATDDDKLGLIIAKPQ
jgi:hypothetical protein